MKRCKIILQDILMVWEVRELSRRKRKRLVRQEKQRTKDRLNLMRSRSRNEKITDFKGKTIHIDPTIGNFMRTRYRLPQGVKYYKVNFQHDIKNPTTEKKNGRKP